MAVPLATLEAKRDALIEALGSGEASISFEGRRVDYRSTEEMLKALAFLNSQIAAAGGGSQTASGTNYGYVKR
jgi:hypothetical protein